MYIEFLVTYIFLTFGLNFFAKLYTVFVSPPTLIMPFLFKSLIKILTKSSWKIKFNLTLAYDHRIIDGKYALEFLNDLKEKLQ